MKRLIFIFIFAGIVFNSYSQPLRVVPWYDWSSPIAFQLSPSPYITGYGEFSDSFSERNNGIQFYEYNGEYYPINSWADYYYWYTQKYWYQFYNPELYAFYYHAKDDYGMARYICETNYFGRMYPSRIIVTFPGKYVYINNLSRRRYKHYVKTGLWINTYYIEEIKPCKKNPTNRREIDRLIVSRKRRSNNNISRTNSERQRNRIVRDNSNISRNTNNGRNTNTRKNIVNNRTNSNNYNRVNRSDNNVTRNSATNSNKVNRSNNVTRNSTANSYRINRTNTNTVSRSSVTRSGTSTNRTNNTTNSRQTRTSGTSRGR